MTVPSGFAVGVGSDQHPLVGGRRLVLGGVRIPFERGLEGHSDGDCLSHALVDALLGAAGQGDIGRRFGRARPRYKGASSQVFLKATAERLGRSGWAVNNVDATVVCERPMLARFLPAMRARLAKAVRVPPARLNLKATTPKGLGPLGASEGIAALVVVSLVKARRA